MDDAVFEQVLLGISDDSFLEYVDDFLDEQSSAVVWDAESIASRGFGPEHLKVHKDYCTLYESRVSSVLRQHDVDADAFATRCARQLETTTSTGNDEASTQEIVATLVSMLDWVVNFETFASSMLTRVRDDGSSSTGSAQE
jgi:hypothetical protein